MKGMGNMMKQAQKLQSQMMRLQEEMAEKTVETTAGGGMVKVTANGKQQLVSIQIEKEVVDPGDVEMLEDMDMSVGRLVDALEEKGFTKDTIVVFASDHGDNLGSHGLFNKNSLIEEAIRCEQTMAA